VIHPGALELVLGLLAAAGNDHLATG